MTAGHPQSRTAGVRVVLHGDGAHGDAVRHALAADPRIDLTVAEATGDGEPTTSGDESIARNGESTACNDVTVHCLSIEADDRTALESAVTNLAGPALVVLPAAAEDDTIAAVRDAGAAAVLVGVDESLPERLAWLAGAGAGDGSDRPTRETVSETIAALGDPVCVVDHRWRVRTATSAFADLTGAAGEPFEGKTLWVACPALRSLADRCWRAVQSGERTTFETGLPGGRVDVTLVPLADGLAVRLRDLSERTAATEAVDRYERILETIDDGIYTLDENFRIVEVNEAVTELTGYDRSELVGSHSTMLADESVILEAGTVIQEILTGERDDGRLDVELETAEGDRLPVETRFSALSFADGSHGSVGVIRDIRDRKRYERTLTALNSSVHELFRAGTAAEVGETVVETATRVLELTSVVVYRYDEEAGELRPSAVAGPGNAPPVGPGDGVLWESFVEGEATRVAAAESLDGWNDLAAASDADPAGDGGLAIPLGAYGLLATVTANDSPRGQTTLTRLLAANAEAALDRVDRSVELERRKEELAHRNRELTHLNRFNELLREVNRVLVEADSREEIERAVCERLVESPAIAFAWMGTSDRSTESVSPRAWAGTERGYLDYLTDPATDCEDEPSHVAARTGDTTVVENVAVDVQRREWRRRALDRGFAAVTSVPLTYNDYRYGVLTVYATDREAFDGDTRLKFEELGVTTANAINGAEAKESLHTGSVVELDLRVTSPNALLFRVARAVGDEVRLEGIVPKSDGSTLHYLTLTGDADVEALSSLAAVESARAIVERDGGTLVEVRSDEETLPSRVADLGGGLRRLVADDGALEVVVELAPGADVREFVETLRETYPDTQLGAKRTRERAVETHRAFRATLEDALTDRQFEVLRTAYLSGYFAWPRERNGQEIAASLDVAQPTFARHLRVAEQKLLERLLDVE